MRPAIILEDAADPDAPNRTIRRARVSDPLRAMALTDREWAAAERLRADNDLATGYREGAGETVRVDRSYTGPAHYTIIQLDARKRLRLLSEVLTRREWDVLDCVVLHWCSLAQTAEDLRIDPETAGRRLRKGLERVGEFYG